MNDCFSKLRHTNERFQRECFPLVATGLIVSNVCTVVELFLILLINRPNLNTNTTILNETDSLTVTNFFDAISLLCYQVATRQLFETAL